QILLLRQEDDTAQGGLAGLAGIPLRLRLGVISLQDEVRPGIVEFRVLLLFPDLPGIGERVAVAPDVLLRAFLLLPALALVEQAKATAEVAPLRARLWQALRGEGVEPVDPAAILDDQALARVLDRVVIALELDHQRRLSAELPVLPQFLGGRRRFGRPGQVF